MESPQKRERHNKLIAEAQARLDASKRQMRLSEELLREAREHAAVARLTLDEFMTRTVVDSLPHDEQMDAE